MAAKRILKVVVGTSCSLCDEALDRLRLPAAIMGVGIVTERLDREAHPASFATRIPVVLDGSDRVLAEGRISGTSAWSAVIRARFAAAGGADSGA